MVKRFEALKIWLLFSNKQMNLSNIATGTRWYQCKSTILGLEGKTGYYSFYIAFLRMISFADGFQENKISFQTGKKLCKTAEGKNKYINYSLFVFKSSLKV